MNAESITRINRILVARGWQLNGTSYAAPICESWVRGSAMLSVLYDDYHDHARLYTDHLTSFNIADFIDYIA